MAGSVGRSNLAYKKQVIIIAFSKKTVSLERGRQRRSSCLLGGLTLQWRVCDPCSGKSVMSGDEDRCISVSLKLIELLIWLPEILNTEWFEPK